MYETSSVLLLFIDQNARDGNRRASLVHRRRRSEIVLANVETSQKRHARVCACTRVSNKTHETAAAAAQRFLFLDRERAPDTRHGSASAVFRATPRLSASVWRTPYATRDETVARRSSGCRVFPDETTMSSNPIRGIRRKKSSLTEVKIAVLGAPGVGKSGESVRSSGR